MLQRLLKQKKRAALAQRKHSKFPQPKNDIHDDNDDDDDDIDNDKSSQVDAESAAGDEPAAKRFKGASASYTQINFQPQTGLEGYHQLQVERQAYHRDAHCDIEVPTAGPTTFVFEDGLALAEPLGAGRWRVPPGLAWHLCGPPTTDATWAGKPMRATPFAAELRTRNPDQQSICQHMLQVLRTRHMACFEAPTGSGKTVMILWLLHQLGRRALFVCHTGVLLKQGMARAAAFLPHLKLGRLRGHAYKKVLDCDIIFVTPRTLAMPNHDPAFMQCFGTLVVDEAHKMATSEMWQASRNVHTRYRFATSATLRRNDDHFALLPAMFGGVALTLQRVWDYIDVKIMVLQYPSQPLSMLKQRYGPFKGRFDFKHFYNQIKLHEGRCMSICERLVQDVQLARGKIFAYATEVEHIVGLQRLLRERFNVEAFCLHAGTADQFRDTQCTPVDATQGSAATIILSTYGSGVEGIDDPDVTVVHFLTPFSKCSILRIEQAIGRCRPGETKPPPLVYDWVDDCPLAWAQHTKRKEYLNTFNPHITRLYKIVG